VRQLFGYERFGDERLVGLMNNLYKNEWSLYQNHFCPSMKLIAKEKINSKYRKKYDKPQTPYQRIMASPHIDEQKKKALTEKHAKLNPFDLKRAIDKKVQYILRLVSLIR
jgi:hypothetical protein